MNKYHFSTLLMILLGFEWIDGNAVDLGSDALASLDLSEAKISFPNVRINIVSYLLSQPY